MARAGCALRAGDRHRGADDDRAARIHDRHLKRAPPGACANALAAEPQSASVKTKTMKGHLAGRRTERVISRSSHTRSKATVTSMRIAAAPAPREHDLTRLLHL